MVGRKLPRMPGGFCRLRCASVSERYRVSLGMDWKAARVGTYIVVRIAGIPNERKHAATSCASLGGTLWLLCCPSHPGPAVSAGTCKGDIGVAGARDSGTWCSAPPTPPHRLG